MATRTRAMQLQNISSISMKCFHRSCLTNAIPFDLKRRCQFTFGKTMRFLNRHFRSNHISTLKLLDEVSWLREAWISDRLKLLKMVSALSGYNNMDDLVEQEIGPEESIDMNGMKEEFDFALANASFPCITVGDSSLVELYDEAQWKNIQLRLLISESSKHFPDSATRKRAQKTNEISANEFGDACQFLRPQLPMNKVSPYEQSFSISLNDSLAVDADSGSELVKFSGKETFLIAEQNPEVYLESILDSSVKIIPDTTRRQCSRLEECGFHTVRKLLHHFPRTYADLQNATGEIDDGAYKIFVGTISSSKALRASSSLSFLDVVVCCESFDDHGTCKKNIYLHLKKFFSGVRFTCRPFLRSLQSKYELGDHVYVCGKVKKMRCEDHYEMREYNIGVLKEEEEQNVQVDKRPYPLYPSKTGLKPSFLMDAISRALKILSSDIDPIPKDILAEFNLPNLFDAYLGIHRPNNLNEADLARRRLNFDEFFYMQLGRLFQMLDSLGTPIEKKELLYKYTCNGLNAAPVEEWSTLTKGFLDALPYSLTPSQLNAISEIICDLKVPVPMNRLLQGDVGCGKTVVAFLACLEVIASGFQAALMVPTELVAIQHYELLSSLLDNLKSHCRPSIALLTGSTSSKQSKMILKGLQTGDINMVIGTHSLIANKVEFSALRLTVIDEQHRFGVIQRGRFNSKLYSASPGLRMSTKTADNSTEDKVNMAPHILTMSATPIPRTLALAIYGDMSLTQYSLHFPDYLNQIHIVLYDDLELSAQITDLPPGRMTVETFVLEGNEVGFENVFQMIRDELLSGGKVYLVYPVIEESMQLPQLHAARRELESISNKFDSYTCGLLHGRMKSEEKYEVLKKFKSGETRVLLATQVIEIGVDVPDATMMVVMNAERFGFAQLHQLRGRVGRGMRKSKCVFLSSTSGALNRLKILEQSSDGFNLAMADLLVRGPGNLLGKKQSGHLPDFPIARLELDGNILRDAHLAAVKILNISHDLSSFPKLQVELSMRKPLCILGD